MVPLTVADYKVFVGDALNEYEDYQVLVATWRVNGWKLQNACGPFGPELSIDTAIRYRVVEINVDSIGELIPAFTLAGRFDVDPRRPIDPERPWSVMNPNPSLWRLVEFARSFDEIYLVQDIVGPLTRNADATNDPQYCQ
jgi:hypothetical protein